ncbi:hypothetical protein [Erwinia sp. V71]|uniref:hypothetical protein n=1 Tax=Erwinia sp. V71 TaxID=3369424 RepID=UPI003F5ECC05
MYVFEFARTYQFTEDEIKEYIEENNIDDIGKINVDDLIHFTCGKYKIAGWGDDCLTEESDNNEDDFIIASVELLAEKLNKKKIDVAPEYYKYLFDEDE